MSIPSATLMAIGRISAPGYAARSVFRECDPDVAEYDSGSFPDKCLRNCVADSAGCARDENSLMSGFHEVSLSGLEPPAACRPDE